MKTKQWLCVSAAMMLIWAGAATPARAQNEPGPEQLKKMYDDALVQLKAAQDRKNELAIENEKLQKQIDEFKRQAAGYAEKTYYLRSHYELWQRFIARYPQLAARWSVFLESDLLGVPGGMPEVIDPSWPLSAAK